MQKWCGCTAARDSYVVIIAPEMADLLGVWEKAGLVGRIRHPGWRMATTDNVLMDEGNKKPFVGEVVSLIYSIHSDAWNYYKVEFLFLKFR